MHESASHHDKRNGARVPSWLWPHVLSLEAPLIAVLWQALFAEANHVAIMPSFVVGLALAAWLLYVIDRLLDAVRSAGAALDARHAFYRRHAWWIGIIVLPLTGVLLGWLALTAIPEGLMWQCLALALLAGIYMSCHIERGARNRTEWWSSLAGFSAIIALVSLPAGLLARMQMAMLGSALLVSAFFRRPDGGAGMPKELAGSLLFAMGCTLGVQFFSTGDSGAIFSADVLLLWPLVAMNMLGIAAVESERGSGLADSRSAAVVWPRLSAHYLKAVLLLAGAVFSILLLPGSLFAKSDKPAVAVTAGLLLLAVLWWHRRHCSALSYRVLADLAVVLPVLFLLR